MTEKLVLVEDRGNVRVISLNRPSSLNAITGDLLTQLKDELTAANSAPSLRALVLTGVGSSFCAGDDLHDSAAHNADLADHQKFVDTLQDITRLLIFGRLPVIAAVRGWAVGGGLEWVFNADFVIAGTSTKGFFPEMNLGLFPTGAITAILPRVVGGMRATALLMLGDRVNATQLQEWGVAHQVVPDEAVVEAAVALGERIAGMPERSVTALRATLRKVAKVELDVALAAESEATVASFADPETPARLARLAPK
jgi:enoyl-CoA hydratase/carnithine racemase